MNGEYGFLKCQKCGREFWGLSVPIHTCHPPRPMPETQTVAEQMVYAHMNIDAVATDGCKVAVAKPEAVEHPPHYTFSKYEVLDVLLEWFPNDPLLWQVGKYIARAHHKGNKIEDLKKARFYLNRAIEAAEQQQQP